MPIKQKIPYSHGVFFITFTCHDWIPLIELTHAYDLVYKWYDQLKLSGHYVVGYAIMPNHIHSLLAFQNTGKDINKIVGNGKRFIGYEIVKRLYRKSSDEILIKLKEAVHRSDRERKKVHEIWEDSFDWKDCRSQRMILQKLDYMHVNPCVGKWQLVAKHEDYPHSSTKFYITGETGNYPVLHFWELEDLDLSKMGV